MKIILTLFILCLFHNCKANVIDKLVTLEDVISFLKSKDYNKNADYFENLKHDSTSKLSRVKFLKIDLNKDGLTDLVVNGRYLFIAIDLGNGNFKFDAIDGGTFMSKQYSLINIDTVTNKQPLIIVKPYSRFTSRDTVTPGLDSLTLSDNEFIEYNRYHESKPIYAISMATSPCFGSCPIFTITMKDNGDTFYNAEEYNKKKGKFIANVSDITKQDLFEFANYINISLLKDNYRVNWTDDQTTDIEVTYKDGSVKHISDYGGVGTFGLRELYKRFYAIRRKTKWTKQSERIYK